jgi:hypothetical protein
MSQAVDEQEFDSIHRNEKGTDTSQHRFLFILGAVHLNSLFSFFVDDVHTAANDGSCLLLVCNNGLQVNRGVKLLFTSLVFPSFL